MDHLVEVATDPLEAGVTGGGVVRSTAVRTRLAVWGGVLIVVAVLVWLGWQLRSGDLDSNDKLASVLSLFVGLLSLGMGALQLRQSRTTVPVEEAVQLEGATKTLAEAIRAQWEDEAGIRSISRPEPLQVGWSSTSRAVAAPAHTVADRAIVGRPTRLRLHGQLNELAEKYIALPHRRLVILGEPGAGKIVLAMLLTLELLFRRKPGEPVPVLLSVASWNPQSEHLHAWIARRISEDYPALLNTATYGSNAAQRLVAAKLILPILDGFDELPEPLQAVAIRELDRAHSDQPLVVTSRSQEYEAAVGASGEVLAAAAVVEIDPLSVDEVIAFLVASTLEGDPRWKEIITHLKKYPDRPLAAAFSTPLIVALARTIYTGPSRDPGELLVIAESSGQAGVEEHVLAAFLPAVYAARPPSPGVQESAGRLRWTSDEASRWLSLLAANLNERDTVDLAWWELRHLGPRNLDRLVVGLTIGLVTLILIQTWLGIVLALALGFTGAMGTRSTRTTPARVNVRIRGRTSDLLEAMRGGLSVVLIGGLLGGIAGGLVGFFGDYLVDAAVFGALAGLLVGFVAGPVLRFEQWLGVPADDAVAVNPQSIFRGDRIVAIVNIIIYGIGGAILGIFGGLNGLLAGSLWAAIGFGMGDTAWGQFWIVRIWLFARGLPIRIMTFLEDAHKRGVFRMSGSVYQFRHLRLQEHLVGITRGNEMT